MYTYLANNFYHDYMLKVHYFELNKILLLKLISLFLFTFSKRILEDVKLYRWHTFYFLGQHCIRKGPDLKSKDLHLSSSVNTHCVPLGKSRTFTQSAFHHLLKKKRHNYNVPTYLKELFKRPSEIMGPRSLCKL